MTSSNFGELVEGSMSRSRSALITSGFSLKLNEPALISFDFEEIVVVSVFNTVSFSSATGCCRCFSAGADVVVLVGAAVESLGAEARTLSNVSIS